MIAQSRTLSSARRLAAAAAGVTLLLTGCSDTGLQEAAPAEDSGAEVDGGAVGPDVRVNRDLSLLQVQIARPPDGVYEEGDDARLFLAVANTGTEPVTLMDISGPGFDGVRVEAEDGSGLPLEVGPDDNLYFGAVGPPTTTLLDLGRELRSSQSIPVTFTFAEAGDVTVDAMVSAEEDPAAPFDFPNRDPEVRPGEEEPTG